MGSLSHKNSLSFVILSAAKDLGNTHFMYPRFFASL